MRSSQINIFLNFFMSATRFKPEGSYAGRRLNIQLWYDTPEFLK